MNPWIKKNDTQWLRKVNENEYCIVCITLYEVYILQEVHLDFSTLTDEEMQIAIEGNYDSMEKVKAEYPDTWKEIIAELIAKNTETDSEYDKCFEELDELHSHLQMEYGIEID